MIADDITHWARNGDVNIAYKVLGEGPMDLIFLTGLMSHIEVLLEEPGLRRWFERLGRIAQVPLVRGGSIRRLPGPLSGWTRARNLRPVARESFRDWWSKRP